MFQTPAQIAKIETLADKTLKLIVLVARELEPEEELQLFQLRKAEGWFVFSKNALKEKDIPKDQAKIKVNEKSPSSRLRAVIYRYWEQNHSTDFELFYNMEIEKLIDNYKGKLN